jgi:CBS domain-containing protein
MKVKDVMTRGAECICPDASLKDAAQMMKDLDVGPLPVCENDRIVGFITDRDIVIRGVCEGCDNTATKVSDVMTPGIVYCFEGQDVEEAADIMREKQIRRLAVLDDKKRLVGIVSLGDLAVETHDDQLAGETLERISEPAHV